MDKKFIVYLTAGYPGIEDSFYFMRGISDLVDGIEIGIPFSDPLADGPVIHQASSYALANGLKIKDVFEKAKALTSNTDKPVYFMTYYNILFNRGIERFVRDAKNCAVRGLIIPDCPLDEAEGAINLCRRHGLSWVPFITPTTDDKRAKRLFRIRSDFIYYVSVTGITGARPSVNKRALEHIAELKRRNPNGPPIFLGFGISSPETVKQAYKSADGVIVGSALMKEIDVNKDKKWNLDKLREKIRWMRQS